MSRFAERFREEGLQQGLQQSMQEGLQQGEALVLERQLRLKFGELPEVVQRRIKQANEPTLLNSTRSYTESPFVLSSGLSSAEDYFVVFDRGGACAAIDPYGPRQFGNIAKPTRGLCDL